MPVDRPIILFGSSLNPPTKAHKALISHMIESTKDQNPRPLIVIAPVYKHILSKPDLADYSARLHLTQKQFEKEIAEGLVMVSNIEEIVNKHHNPDPTKQTYSCGTVDVLRYIKDHPELFPGADVKHLSFMLGGDTYKDFLGGLWKEAENIIELCEHFHVFGRDGAEPLAPTEVCNQAIVNADSIQEMSKALVRKEKLSKISAKLETTGNADKFIMHHSVIKDTHIQNLSSTKVRNDREQLLLGVEEPVLNLMMSSYPELYNSSIEHGKQSKKLKN